MNFSTKKIKLFIILAIVLACFIFLMINSASASYGLDYSIKQVKTANNNAVYYLDHARGIKKVYNNEIAFLSYGNKWSYIKIISEDELKKWKEAYLVKINSDQKIYYINGNKKALIRSAEDFINSSFNWGDVITISEADLNTYVLTEFKAGGGDGDFIEDGRVSVELGSSNLIKNNISINTTDNLVGVFNLKSEKGIVNIKSLTIYFDGIFDHNIIKNVRLQDMDNENYEFNAVANSKEITFNLFSNPLIIPQGTIKKIGIYVDLDFAENVLNNSFSISLDKYNYINTESWVSGNFPINSSLIKIVDISESIGKIKVEQQSLSNINHEASVGNIEHALAKYKISEISGNENILIKELIFKDFGSGGIVGADNFILKNSKNQIISKGIISDLSEVKFNFFDYKIKKNDYEYFTVYSDIISGNGKTIKLELFRTKIYGDSNNFGLLPEILNINEIVAINKEMLGVISAPLESNNHVFKEQSGTIIGLFQIRNDNQEISIDSIEISLEKSSSAFNLTNTLYLINYNTGHVINYANSGLLNNESIVLGLNNQKLGLREELDLAFVSEISRENENGNTYKINLDNITYRAANGEYYSDKVNAVGRILTVSKSDLYIYENSEEGELYVSKGDEKAKIASFILESSAGEDVKINSIILSKSDSSGSLTYDNGFSNIRIYIGSKKIKQIIEKPYSNTYVFEDVNYKMFDNKRVEIKVYADIDENARLAEAQLAITGISAVSYDSGIEANISGLNKESFKAIFEDVVAEVSSIAGGRIYAGEDDNLVASFKIRNTGNEELKLKYTTIKTSSSGFSNSLGYSNLRIVNKETSKIVGSRILKPVAGANRISLGSYKLKAGEEILIDIYVDADATAQTDNFKIYLNDLKAIGAESNVEAKVTGNYSYANTNISGGNGSITIEDIDNIKFIKPISGSITYYFHDPDYPFAESFEHPGIDIKASQGTRVKSAADGIVSVVVDAGYYYSYVIIKHNNNNLETVYGHLSRIDVRAGEIVEQGQTIGLSGGKPGTPGAGEYTTGPHLHFEVRLNGVPVDPMDYLD